MNSQANRKFYFEIDKTNMVLNPSHKPSEMTTTYANNTNVKLVLSYFIDLVLKRCELVLIINRLSFNQNNELTYLRLVNRHFRLLTCYIKNLNYALMSNNKAGSLTTSDSTTSLINLSKTKVNVIKLLDNLRVDVLINEDSSTSFIQRIFLCEINAKCDYFNFYVYNDNYIFRYLVEKYSYTKHRNEDEKLIELFKVNCRKVIVDFKSTYLNLILANERDTIYKFGAKEINAEWSKSDQIELSLVEFILLRTTNKKLTDIDYINKSNATSYKTKVSPGNFKHYWGNLINLNLFRFQYVFCKRFLSLYVDQLLIEYIPSNLISAVEFLASKMGSINKNNDEKSIASNQMSGFKLKLKFNSINIYFLFEKKYFVHFNMNRFKLIRLENDFNMIVNNLSSIQYRFAFSFL